MKYSFYAIALLLLFTFTNCRQEPENKKIHLGATEVKQLLENKQEVVVLDVRTPQEFQEGHLEGAVNIDYTSSGFEQEIAGLDTAATYLLYCRSGNRSSRATTLMTSKNFKHLYNATAGFEELKSVGIPTK